MKLIAIIGAWMLLLTGGYLAVRGGDDPNPPPAMVATGPDQTAPGTKVPPESPAQAPTGAAHPSPSGGAVDTPAVEASTASGVDVYTPEELDRLRVEDPQKHTALTVDPQDRNPVLRRKHQAALDAHPAFQRMPHTADGVTIDFTGRRDGDSIEITVTGPRKAAERELDAFLRRHGDRRGGYVIRFTGDRR